MPPILNHSKLSVPVDHDYAHLHGRVGLMRMVQRVRNARYASLASLAVEAWCTAEPVPYSERESGDHRPLKPGDAWGGLFDCAWMKMTASVPEGTDMARLVARIDVNGEACVFRTDGVPYRGLTCGTSVFDRSLGEPGKDIVRDLQPFVRDGEVELWLDCGCNDLFGNLQGGGTLRVAELALENPTIVALYHDLEVLISLAESVDSSSAHHHAILHALHQATLKLGVINEETAAAARQILAPELKRNGGDSALHVTAAGHAHIDLAWLWPLRETHRKIARTFATLMRNLERYPDYRFCASQPQLYQWLKEQHPALYKELCAAVSAGRVEPIGAMWVEADVNMPSGESLARQLLHGKRFFKQEFGHDARTLFIPDDFGYSGALPQLMKEAGVDYLVTIKMSWDEFAPFPHHSFRWSGMDGSEVVVHMPPEGDYNSAALPASVAKAESNYAEKAIAPECLLLFGIGDGGGGAGEEHLERLARMDNRPGIPSVSQGSIEKFLDRLGERFDDLPTWQGEMFLHRHQGTYTTQNAAKKWNRRMEATLRAVELVRVAAFLDKGEAYPREQLERIWKEFLLYQFHDILPGSSITRVYDEAIPRYEAMYAELLELAGVHEPTGDGEVFNSLPWPVSGILERDGSYYGYGLAAHASGELSSLGTAEEQQGADLAIENEHIRVEFAKSGALALLANKATGDTIAGDSNTDPFPLFHDHGDAWDFPRHTQSMRAGAMQCTGQRVLGAGDLQILEQDWSFGESRMTLSFRLAPGARRLELHAQLDWREDALQLRWRVPFKVFCNTVRCDCAHGVVERPLHENRAEDRGLYQQLMHQYVDFSETGAGLAVLNDSHYGFHAEPGLFEAVLVRSPHYPDPKADRGTHTFAFALLPHRGTEDRAFVVRQAREMNATPIPAPSTAPVAPIASVDAPSIEVDAIKMAEDSDDVVVRLHENLGARSECRLSPGFHFDACHESSIMEEAGEKLDADSDGSIVLSLRPFELKTLLFRGVRA